MRFAGNIASLLLSSVIGLCGCDMTSHAPQAPIEKAQMPAPTTRELTKDELGKCFGDNQGTLVPSSTRVLSGDLRPLWIITGKVQNLCEYDLKSVTIRAWVYRKGHREDVFDTADFVLNDVPAQGVRAYRKEIQLMVERKQDPEWTYEEIAATAATK